MNNVAILWLQLLRGHLVNLFMQTLQTLMIQLCVINEMKK